MEKSVGAAIAAMLKENKNFVRLRHALKPGEEVKLHYHPKANEWVVIDDGLFVVRVGGEHYEAEYSYELESRAMAFHFRPGQWHYLRAVTRISYWVFRDRKDKTVYCRKPR